jgi:hypothetical protein
MKELILRRKLAKWAGNTHAIDQDAEWEALNGYGPKRQKSLCKVPVIDSDEAIPIKRADGTLVPITCHACNEAIERAVEQGAVVKFARPNTKREGSPRKKFAVSVNGEHYWFDLLSTSYEFAKNELLRLEPNCSIKVKAVANQCEGFIETSIKLVTEVMLAKGRVTLSPGPHTNLVVMIYEREEYDKYFIGDRWDKCARKPEVLEAT